MSDGTRRYSHIGKPFPVVEDIRFVRGRGRYINDLQPPGMLHLAPAAAPLAHARLLSVDVEAARHAPGVVAVLTGRDLVELMEPVPQNIPLPKVRWYPLAVDKVRFAGEWTAAIIAISRAAAEDAAELVEADYDELPAVIDPEAAMAPGTTLLHEDQGSNVVWQDQWTWGSVDEAMAGADRVFEYRFRWGRHSGVPIETFGCVASVERATDILNIWASHQNPNLAEETAGVLRLPSHRVRVHQDIDVGGSYGSKRGREHIFLTCVAAMMTHRPVKFIEDRTENLKAGGAHGPDRVFYIRLGAGADGIVSAIDLHTIDDVGAYVGRGPLQMAKPINAIVGPYRIGHVRYAGSAVVTNKTNQAPFRGFGQSPHNFVLERALDRVARELGIDPVEIRRRNYIGRDEFPYRIPSGSVYDSGDFEGVLDKAVEKADLAHMRAFQREARAQGRIIGIGVAGCLEPAGGHPATYEFMNPRPFADVPEAARIQVDRAGHVIATIGFQSAGQSHEAMVTQIVCEELGVAPDDVTVLRADSLGGIVGSATTGSRMTIMLGTALVLALGKVRDKLSRIAAHHMQVDPEDVVCDGSTYSARGETSRSYQLAEIARVAYQGVDVLPPGMELGIVESAVFAGIGAGKHLHDRRMQAGFPSYAFSAHIPLVEIDPETFAVKIERYIVVHDCGQVMNPLVVDGMVFGGIAHAIGGALYERFAYDQDGQPKAASFMDYLMPTATEIPQVELYSRQTDSPLHPYGAKGSAEGGYMTAPAALASAVEDALAPFGVDVSEIPISPLLIFDLVHKGESRTVPE